jgi:Cu2+-exporting ATPase
MTDHDDHKHNHQDHHDHHDHAEHHRRMIADFRRRFFVSLAASLPILVLSPFVQGVFGFEVAVPGQSWIVLGFATFVFAYGGKPFLTGLVEEIGDRQPGMMTLIAMAITVAWGYSAAVTLGLSGRPFFWELATLIDVMLAGHWIEMRAVLRAQSALEELARLMPDVAHRERDGQTEDVPLDEVREGDVLVIRPGEKVPADGEIVDGRSDVDESMLTGESRPVSKGEGDELIGGAINGDGSLRIEVRATGEDSYLSQVIDLVRTAQAEKSRTQHLSDRAALWLTVAAVSAGLVTLAAWLAVGSGTQAAISRMATVMVITCPHALGLAIPLVVSVSTTRAAGHGLLIRDRTAFENARKIDTVVFDKTGTLTEGTFAVREIVAHVDGWTEQEVLALAASLEASSQHPIAGGIRRRAEDDGVETRPVDDFDTRKGLGVVGRVDGAAVAVGGPAYLEHEDLERPGGTDEEPGETRVFVVRDGEVVGSIALADRIREHARDAVAALQERGIACWMLTGDNETTARAVAEELRLAGHFAGVLPDEKEQKIRELQDDGRFVAMTGDGVNDSPALARADVGIAVGSGTDVAAATADIVLVNSDPRDISALILFGRATHRKMVQNLWYAAGYNIVAIPLAAGALAWAGIVLSPAVGALLMSLSTVVVAINARLLRVPDQEVAADAA